MKSRIVKTLRNYINLPVNFNSIPISMAVIAIFMTIARIINIYPYNMFDSRLLDSIMIIMFHSSFQIFLHNFFKVRENTIKDIWMHYINTQSLFLFISLVASRSLFSETYSIGSVIYEVVINIFGIYYLINFIDFLIILKSKRNKGRIFNLKSILEVISLTVGIILTVFEFIKLII